MSLIAEDVLLIAHTHVETREFAELDELTEILAGGCLVAEALLAGMIRLDDGRRFSTGPRAVTADVDPLVDRAARHALTVAPAPDTEFDDERWIATVTYPVQAGAEVIDRLRARGAVGSEEQKKFGRKAKQVDITDAAALDQVGGRLRAVMLEGATPDPTTAVTLLLIAATGASLDLDRGERKRWNDRSEALFTWMYWQGDDGTPAEPVPGIDDETRRMLGDFAVSLGTAYQMGISAEISNALKLLRPY